MQFPILSVTIFAPLIAGLIILLLPAGRKAKSRSPPWRPRRCPSSFLLWTFLSLRFQRRGIPVHRKSALAAGAGHLLLPGNRWDHRPAAAAWRDRGRVRRLDLVGRGRPDTCEYLCLHDVPGHQRLRAFSARSTCSCSFSSSSWRYSPSILMIAVWGSPKTREYGAMKLTLYLFIGSVIALVGVLAMYFQSGLQHLRYAGPGKGRFRRWLPALWPSRWSSWVLPSWAVFSPSTAGRRMVTWRRQRPFPCCWPGLR